MSHDTRELPAGPDGLTRFLGGSPLAVAFRLILLSILVGVVLAAIGFDPWNILHSIQTLFRRLWDLGFDAVNWLWRYFLLGAVIVIPVWLLSRMFGAPVTGPKLTTLPPTARWRSGLRAWSTKRSGAVFSCAATSSRPRRTICVDSSTSAPPWA